MYVTLVTNDAVAGSKLWNYKPQRISHLVSNVEI